MQMAMESMEKMRMMKKRTMNDGTCWLASLASRHMSGCGAFIQIIKLMQALICLIHRDEDEHTLNQSRCPSAA